MPRAADILADETTAHAFTLLRVAAGLRVKALAEVESLFTDLTVHAEKFGQLTSASGARFRALEIEAGQIIKAAYKVIDQGQRSDLERIAVAEGDFANSAMNKVVGVDIFTKKIDPRVLQQIAAGKIIEGHPASSWWEGQSANLRRRFSGEVSKGILLGETTQQIVKRVVGDIATNGPAGLKRKAKADATALVRTSVQAVGNAARIESFSTMRTVKGIAWLATLDGRTTIICIALDGKKWRLPDFAPIGHNKAFPGPIAHIQCRSTQTAVTYSWEELSGKKIKELDGQTLQAAIESKMEEAGEPPERIAAALNNARASMDGYTRASNTFEKWAEDKTPEFVSSVVGPARYELWNSGHITFNDLTNQDNRPLTVAQLEQHLQNGATLPETLGRAFIPYTAAQIVIAPKASAAAEITTPENREAAEAMRAKVEGQELTAKQKKQLAKFALADNAAYEALYDQIAEDVISARRITNSQLIEEARRQPIRQHRAPVADAFDPDEIADIGRRAEFKHALDAIARVHGDGVLPMVQIQKVNEWYDMSVEFGKKPKLNISGHEYSTAFTAVHEIGHVLDFYALGKGKTFGSTLEGKQTAKLRDTIKQSEAFKRAKAVAAATAKTPALQTFHEYLGRDEEIFARAYSQYIATKSNDALLLRQLRRDQLEQFGEAMYWTDSDFAPIFHAFDEFTKASDW